MAAFAVIVWQLPAALPGVAVLSIAAVVWFGAALGAYLVGDRFAKDRKRRA